MLHTFTNTSIQIFYLFFSNIEFLHSNNFIQSTQQLLSLFDFAMLNFYVVFNTKVNVFFPNTEVTATVILHTDGAVKARKIDIKIIGRAKTQWYEYEYYQDYDGCTQSRSIPYGAEISYLNSYAILWASPDGTNFLPPGEYQFPFKFVIPAHSPPNMGGEYGGVSYFVKANIDIPWAIDEARYVGFSVCPLIDLNFDGRLALPVVTAATELESKCCSCTSYPLTMTVNLPKTGFVPGEIIEIKVDLNNTTTSVVTSIELGITSSMIFTGSRQDLCFSYYGVQSMSKLSSLCVTSKTVAINSKENTSATYTLQVPAITPSYADCPIIKISYNLFVKVHTDAVFSSGPQVGIPITIGTVPLRANNPPAADVLANANFTKITIEHKTAETKDKEGPPADYQAQVPYYTNLTPTSVTTA